MIALDGSSSAASCNGAIASAGRPAPRLGEEGQQPAGGDDVNHGVVQPDSLKVDPAREVADGPLGQVDLQFVAVLAPISDTGTDQVGKTDGDGVAEVDAGERLGDDARKECHEKR